MVHGKFYAEPFHKNDIYLIAGYNQTMRRFFTTLFSGLLFASQAISGPYEDGGISHYNNERLSTYLAETAKAAGTGDAVAQFNLGYLYSRGFGLTQDPMKALMWFQKSAEQGLTRAQNHLGLAYIEARGGVSQNYKEAAQWFRKSAALGDAEGAYLLAGLYSEGLGVSQSHANAMKWHLQAAEQNHAYAQLSLGLHYSKGHGVEKNKTLAHMWFDLASQNGSDRAREYEHELVQTMSGQEIREAERLRNKWLDEHQSLEEGYFATRDMFSKKFATEAAVDERPALAALENQIRAIVGAVKIEGFSGQGHINIRTLKAEPGYAQVDGLRFKSNREVLFVTTQGLLKHYLAEHPKLPQTVEETSKHEDFYRRVFHADAGVMLYTEVPANPTKGQSFAQAFLGVSGQDTIPSIPNELFVFVVMEKQIRLINVPSSAEISDIQQCKSKWDISRTKGADALAKYHASQSQDQKAYEEYRRQEEEGVAAYRDCFAKESKNQPWYNALKTQAQSLVNRLQN
ncbi:sel1 repeat family protein [Mariprofundus sp. NF]|uniref:tetratricopeptide repeat protein n=1 Tax=Mariprofundus sp. NF TaxID=2608716 RepID=UPI0015A314D9|nr:tetratricopeptide repeat protein [Mariprofundus sp. NF]NWF38422.1 sel1 repeat family protein [Mariprofundus sp. NF]